MKNKINSRRNLTGITFNNEPIENYISNKISKEIKSELTEEFVNFNLKKKPIKKHQR